MMRSSTEAVLVSLTEEEMARWRRERGARVICHRGRYWEMQHRGFCHAIHWLARMKADEVVRPMPFCWGFRATLREEDAGFANSFMPTHLTQNVAAYDLAFLSSKRRNQIRSCHRQVEIVEVIHADLLGQQGHEVYLSSAKRTSHGRPLSKEQFAVVAKEEISPGRSVVLAGLVEGKIGGYLIANAVTGTAYIDKIYLATEALRTNIGSGLVFEFMQICRRAGTIREVVYGLHSREDPALSKFKDEMGFPVVKIPARIAMIPLARQFIRWRKPHVYYRLFGE